MTNPMALPLRVMVKGPSTVLWTSMMSGPRTDMIFSRVMEQQLLAHGQAVEVRNAGFMGWPTRDLFKTWEDDIVRFSPDVVIVAGGHWEALHTILPSWLERGANTVNRRPGFWRHLYYRRFLRATARGVLLLQKRIDRPGRELNKRRMRRAMVDIAAYIKMTQQVGSPLILLMEMHPPAGVKLVWYGGWAERVVKLNNSLRALVEEIDKPNVRFVGVTDLMQQFNPGGPEDLWADGIHFSPEFHRAVGEKFAGIAEEWASSQPHLAQP
jgi:lysophospholipase L1-like esterase